MITDLNKECVVCTGAFRKGLCGILMYEGQVIFYESWRLNQHEKSYRTHDLELVVIIHALNM